MLKPDITILLQAINNTLSDILATLCRNKHPDGSMDNPYKTIKDAMDSTGDGNIFVKPPQNKSIHQCQHYIPNSNSNYEHFPPHSSGSGAAQHTNDPTKIVKSGKFVKFTYRLPEDTESLEIKQDGSEGYGGSGPGIPGKIISECKYCGEPRTVTDGKIEDFHLSKCDRPSQNTEPTTRGFTGNFLELETKDSSSVFKIDSDGKIQKE